MKLKVLSLIAASAFLAACASEPEEQATTTETTQTATAPAPAPAPTVEAPAPGSREDFLVNVGDRVFFDFDKSDLRPDAIQTLEQQAAFLRRYGQYSIVIEGHADERGTREYNLALGDRRATSVRDFLVSLGIDADRIRTISYGKERPAVEGSGEAVWSQNRRGVTVLQGPAS